MSTILGVLFVVALLVAWAEHRAAERLVRLSKTYQDEGRRSWDLGEQRFREAIARSLATEETLRECQRLVGTPIVTPEEHDHE